MNNQITGQGSRQRTPGHCLIKRSGIRTTNDERRKLIYRPPARGQLCRSTNESAKAVIGQSDLYGVRANGRAFGWPRNSLLRVSDTNFYRPRGRIQQRNENETNLFAENYALASYTALYMPKVYFNCRRIDGTEQTEIRSGGMTVGLSR